MKLFSLCHYYFISTKCLYQWNSDKYITAHNLESKSSQNISRFDKLSNNMMTLSLIFQTGCSCISHAGMLEAGRHENTMKRQREWHDKIKILVRRQHFLQIGPWVGRYVELKHLRNSEHCFPSCTPPPYKTSAVLKNVMWRKQVLLYYKLVSNLPHTEILQTVSNLLTQGTFLSCYRQLYLLIIFINGFGGF